MAGSLASVVSQTRPERPVAIPESIATATPSYSDQRATTTTIMNSTFFGILAEFGEANIPLEKVAPKYFGLSYAEARRRAPAKLLPCRAFRLGGQKSPWLVSAADLAELIDRQRSRAQ